MKPTHSPSASITHGEKTIDLGKIREKRDKRAKRVKKNQKTGKKGGGGLKREKQNTAPRVCVFRVSYRARGALAFLFKGPAGSGLSLMVTTRTTWTTNTGANLSARPTASR